MRNLPLLPIVIALCAVMAVRDLVGHIAEGVWLEWRGITGTQLAALVACSLVILYLCRLAQVGKRQMVYMAVGLALAFPLAAWEGAITDNVYLIWLAIFYLVMVSPRPPRQKRFKKNPAVSIERVWGNG